MRLLNQDTSHMYFLALYFWEAKEISYKTTAEATAKTITVKESESVSRSVLSDSAPPWTVAHQAPLSMEFSRQELLEWVAIPFSRGSSQPRGQTQAAALQPDSLPSEPPGKLIKRDI